MKLPLKAIHYFEAAARLGSYSEAARELYVSHGAVLSQVQKLESWLGLKLFVRRNGRIHLSEEGKNFAERISPAFQLLEQAVTDTRFEQRHKIIISAIPSLAAHFLLPHIREFHNLYPQVDLELHYCLDGHYPPDSHFVLGFFDAAHPPKGGSNHILFSGASLPVCGSGYLNRSAALSPRQIARHVLLHDHTKTSWQDWFGLYGQAGIDTVHLKQGAVYSDFNLLHTAVLNNSGIALCPYILLYEEIAAGRLNVLSANKGNLDRYYYFSANKPCRRTVQETITAWLLGLAEKRRHAAAGLGLD